MGEQEADYEFFRAGVDGRKEGQQATDKRPAMVGGILGLGGLAYMARQFKNKPKDMKISVYLIHTRMYAQMTVVGVLCCGMLNHVEAIPVKLPEMLSTSRLAFGDYSSVNAFK